MATYRLSIPDFTPTLANALLRSVRGRIRAKRSDRDVVGWYARESGVPHAAGRRRVGVVLAGWARGGRLPDPDAPLKSLLDALVHAKLLVDDSARWCELGGVRVERAAARLTVVYLEDLEDVPS